MLVHPDLQKCFEGAIVSEEMLKYAGKEFTIETVLIIVARFYLENAQNGKQTKENYEQINKATFIDLQNNVYQQLIDKTWEIEKDELIKNIKTSLINSNENILNNFKYEKEKYRFIANIFKKRRFK